jgi:hypothetical protein
VDTIPSGYWLCGRGCEDSFLYSVHLARVSALSVIEAMQMQKAMHDVQSKFARERISEGPSLPPRCLDADKDFPVLKRQHVCWSRLIEKLSM